MASAVVFFSSLAFLVVFTAVMHWERMSGARLFVGVRNALDAYTISIGQRVWRMVNIPVELLAREITTKTLVRSALHAVAQMVARGAYAVETSAHRLAEYAGGPHTHERSGTTQSAYLRDVANHKNSLDIESIKKENSVR